MRLNDLVNFRPTMEKIAAIEMEPAVAFEFAKFVRVVAVELQNFEAKRADLFRKYGGAMGEGEEQRLQILPENEKEFNAAIQRTLDTEVGIEPFDLSILNLGITPLDLVNSIDMFK